MLDIDPAGGARPDRRAVVVGGGIGGLAAARGLQLAGCSVQVLERSQQLEPVGAGISLWPNAVVALDALDVPLRQGRDRDRWPGRAGTATWSPAGYAPAAGGG